MNVSRLVSEVIEALITDDQERQPMPSSLSGSDKAVIPIFFTIDDGYAPFLGVALHSLIANASKDYDYDINILHQGLSDSHLERLRGLAQPGFSMKFIRMNDKIDGIVEAHHNKLRQDYFTLTIFFRLFIPAMFPEYHRGIYIDSDVVIPGDISKMFEIDLEGNLIGACRDLSIKDIPELVAYTNDAVGVGIENYINSGVLLMDFDALREAKLDERFLELLTKYQFPNIAPDQDYLNVLCHGKIRYMDPEWDAMPTIGQQPQASPKLIHYNLFAKPWCYDDIPYEEYFWEYADETDFIDEIRAYKTAYSEEQKQSDSQCLQTLLDHGAELAEADFNFRTIFNTGIEARL